MDHKAFCNLRLTSPSFDMQPDRSELESIPSVVPIPTDVPPKNQRSNPAYIVLQDHGLHLDRIVVGDSFYDGHIVILRNIASGANKLVQLDIVVDTKIGTLSRVSNDGRAMLATIIPQLDNCQISMTSRFNERHWIPLRCLNIPVLVFSEPLHIRC